MFQDQDFVNIVIEKILENCEIKECDTLLLESDCKSQYKWSEHFDGISSIANKYNINIVRVFGVAGHGKGEVDYVGGIAKVTIRRER